MVLAGMHEKTKIKRQLSSKLQYKKVHDSQSLLGIVECLMYHHTCSGRAGSRQGRGKPLHRCMVPEETALKLFWF